MEQQQQQQHTKTLEEVWKLLSFPPRASLISQSDAVEGNVIIIQAENVNDGFLLGVDIYRDNKHFMAIFNDGVLSPRYKWETAIRIGHTSLYNPPLDLENMGPKLASIVYGIVLSAYDLKGKIKTGDLTLSPTEFPALLQLVKPEDVLKIQEEKSFPEMRKLHYGIIRPLYLQGK